MRDRMLRGIETLANAVRVTLGPKGRNVVLDKATARRASPGRRDGGQEIELEDKFENMGAQMVREVAQANDQAGDGTTTRPCSPTPSSRKAPSRWPPA